MSKYLAVPIVASVAGVTPRALEIACSRIIRGKSQTWRGANLVVRQVAGRGGRSGLHFEVHADSLPPNIKQLLKCEFSIVEAPSNGLPQHRSAERDWWSLTLSPALAQPPHSRARGDAIDAILARPLTDWNGQPYHVSRRTVERKISAVEKQGVRGLAGRVRADKGIVRVAISKPWDRATKDLPLIERERIAVELKNYVRGLLKDGAQYAVVSQLVAGKLNELTVNAIGEAALDLPAETFNVPRRFIAQERKFKKVAIFNKDRKAYEDAKPRIMRTRQGLEPMSIVVGDVHHVDIVMRRPDGSEAWPKAIAWLDLATNRIWFDIVLLGPGEGIRNADVIASFIAMVSAWGLPRALYLDNGSEYRWSDFIDDALKLVGHIDYDANERDSQIVRAKPYNAPAKAIEGIFGILEQRYFRTLQGWAGGDRTNKKTANVGKPPEPYPGTIDDLRNDIGAFLTLYHNNPQRGSLKKRSPRQVFDAALDAGWERVGIDGRELHAVFATDDTRIPHQGYISFGGDKWTCPELHAFLGDKIIVRIPKFAHPTVIPLLEPSTRKIVGFAERAIRYGILDPAGARAAAAMDKTQRQSIRALDRSAPDVSTNAEVTRFAATIPEARSAPIVATLGISDEAADIARGMAEPEDARADRRKKALRTERQKRLAAYSTGETSL